VAEAPRAPATICSTDANSVVLFRQLMLIFDWYR